MPSDGLLHLLRTSHNRKEQCIKIVLSGFLRQDLDLGMNFLGNPTLAARLTHFCRGFAGLVRSPVAPSSLTVAATLQSCPVTPKNQGRAVTHIHLPESFSFSTKLRPSSLSPARSRRRRG